MHLTDKQIKQIMELADQYAHVYSSSFLSPNLKASARFKLEKTLMQISIQSDNQEPEPVYEYQWLIKNHDNGTVFVTSMFYKSYRDAIEYWIDGNVILERLDKYKREAKE